MLTVGLVLNDYNFWLRTDEYRNNIVMHRHVAIESVYMLHCRASL